MTHIQFYHLLATPLDRALPKLMEKALGAGMRGVILAPSQAVLEQIDDALWSADAASFLPHGTAGCTHPERQPLYLALAEENPNQANLLVITNGSTPADANGYARILDVFDGHSQREVVAARARWKQYKDAGHSLEYIQQQSDGSWKKQA